MKMKSTVACSIVMAMAISLLGTACTPAGSEDGNHAGRHDIPASGSTAPGNADRLREDVEKFGSVMRAHGIPGAQLVHSGNGSAGEIEYGVMRTDSDAQVSDLTVFEAASLSKVVGAYITLRLVDQGKIDLDTPLWDYWQSPRIAHDALAKKITARMVLNHTSGLPNWQISPTNPALDSTPIASAFPPGARFSYSGEGFYLLQKTIEHLTGVAWNELATREVFTPFDMPHSSFVSTPARDAFTARGHGKDGTPRQQRIFATANTAFTLVTSARDYHNFIHRGLYLGEGLQPSTRNMMFTASSNADDQSAPSTADPYISWGLGVGIQVVNGRKLIWHWGDNPGFKALFMFSPDTGESMLLFTNSENGLSTYQEVLELFMGQGPYPVIDWVRTQD